MARLKHKPALLFTLLAIILTVIACSLGKISKHPDDWLIWRMGAEPDTLNPLLATDVSAGTVNNYLYESLAERNLDTLELYPKLATTWEISPDKLVYTFKIRKDVKFHDGAPVTAHNFKYYYDRVTDEKVNAPHLRNYFRDITSADVLDDYTIRFTCSRPYFLALEICGGVQAIPKHLFEKGKDFNKALSRAAVGTGPYKFGEWATGQKIVLDRFDGYWGPRPEIKSIVFRLITESSSALIELKKRQLDFMYLNSLQWVRQTGSARFNEAFRKEQYYQPNYSFIGWNSRRPYFSDKRVRRAMTMLVNREEILNTLMFGLGIIVSGPDYVKGPYYDQTIKPWPYDPEGAKKLLDEAGWSDHDGDGVRDKDGMPFKFEFLIPSTSGSDLPNQLGTKLKEELQNFGIQMSIRPLEWAAFIRMLDDRQFDAVTLGWSLGVESDHYQIWHSSQAKKGSNFVGFSNPEADRIIEQARRTFDRDERTKLMRRFHAIIHDEQPYTFMFCRPELAAISKRFGNVVVHNLGIEPKEWTVPSLKKP